MKILALLACIFLPLIAATAHAGTIVLTWQQDTAACSDGSPMAANCPLAGFQINDGATVDSLALKENAGPGTRSMTYQNVAAGTTRCYSLKAFTGTSAAPILSAESARSCVTVPFLPPKAPQGLTVTVQVTIVSP